MPKTAGKPKSTASGKPGHQFARRARSRHIKTGGKNAIARKLLEETIRVGAVKVGSKFRSKKFEFVVFINGEKVTVSEEKVTRGKRTPVEATKVATKKFDPFVAGDTAVAKLQAAGGGAWTGPELATQFGLSSANLHKRRAEHRVVSWRDPKNQFFYPKWQFNEAGALLPGIQEVLQTFRSSDEWRVMRYFLGKRNQLEDRTPLDLLRAGEVDKVLAHAKAHAEENTW